LIAGVVIAGVVIARKLTHVRTLPDAFCDILKTEGVRGLYRGYTASMMVYVPSSGIWWGTYASGM
jgi:solute carrier family 25 protein 44